MDHLDFWFLCYQEDSAELGIQMTASFGNDCIIHHHSKDLNADTSVL